MMTTIPANNYRVAGGLGVVAIASFLFAYLQPPLYRAFCEWTGIYDVQKADEFRQSSVHRKSPSTRRTPDTVAVAGKQT